MPMLRFLPSMRWTPSDMTEPGSNRGKEKSRPHRLVLSRKAAAPDHGMPQRRKSTLSLTSVPDEELDARTHMQSQSMFFAMLPFEVREMVYGYIVGEETVHLTLGVKKRFSHFVCPAGDACTGEGREGNVGAGKDCGCKIVVGGAGQSGRLSTACARLLRVCRRMYTETAPHLYKPHVFSLLHITHLLHLPSRVPQPRLNTIRRLHLRWTLRALPYYRRGYSQTLSYPEDTANWEKAWQLLASLRDLKTLHVALIDPSRDAIWEGHWLGLEEVLLQAVKAVVAPSAFELVLPYASCGVRWDMGASSVVLRRPAVEDEGDAEEV